VAEDSERHAAVRLQVCGLGALGQPRLEALQGLGVSPELRQGAAMIVQHVRGGRVERERPLEGEPRLVKAGERGQANSVLIENRDVAAIEPDRALVELDRRGVPAEDLLGLCELGERARGICGDLQVRAEKIVGPRDAPLLPMQDPAASQGTGMLWCKRQSLLVQALGAGEVARTMRRKRGIARPVRGRIHRV